MVVTLGTDLEAALTKQATRLGIAPEVLALNVLQEGLRRRNALEPRDEWERRLLNVGTDCGVAISHESVSSEGLYE